jgi:predicted NUDIX family NTP pyrophosphohydrolase
LEVVMPVVSAGILLFRVRQQGDEVLLVHPGGPFWAKKDVSAWSIPKGLVGEGENPLLAAQREFREETGVTLSGMFQELGEFRQPGGKRIKVWTLEGDCGPAALVSNTFSMMWPPKSGELREFPEVDRAGWFGEDDALLRVHRGQRPVIEAFFETRRATQSPKG